MNLETLIPFWMKHNATIIEVLIGTSLLVTAFLSIRSFLTAKEPGSSSNSGSSLDISQLEKTLKQILEKAGQVPSVAAASAPAATTATASSGGNSEDGAKLLMEITNLKTELQTKQQQIEELRAAPASASTGTGMSDADKAKLQNQLQELQAKLAEYEIISEDIADLSFYKEQNSKLQKELESLKGGGAPAAASTPPSAAPKMPEPQIVGKSVAAEAEVDPLVAAFEAAQTEAPAPSPVASPATSAEAISAEAISPPIEAALPMAGAETPAASEAPVSDIDTSVDDDLMAEFAAAVEKQKIESGQPSTPPAAATPAASPTTASAGPDLGQLDMEKMISEAALIETNVPDIDAAKALGTDLDENKLLKEAAALEAISNEDKTLMGQFENFVKKNE